jgi:hypothetical protein
MIYQACARPIPLHFLTDLLEVPEQHRGILDAPVLSRTIITAVIAALAIDVIALQRALDRSTQRVVAFS